MQAAPNANEAETDLVLRLFGSSADPEVLDQESFLTFAAAVDENNARLPMTLPQSMVLGEHSVTPFFCPLTRLYPGGVSAMIGASCVFPLDKVKTLIVSQRAAGAAAAKQPNILVAIRNQLVANVKREGLRAGLYRGLAPQLIGIAPGETFFVYPWPHSSFSCRKGAEADGQRSAAAAAARRRPEPRFEAVGGNCGRMWHGNGPSVMADVVV